VRRCRRRYPSCRVAAPGAALLAVLAVLAAVLAVLAVASVGAADVECRVAWALL
jgi:hypothetical protein